MPDVTEEKSYLRLSSVVWSNQREALKAAVGGAGEKKKLLKSHPLVKDGQKLIPSITKVFRKDQQLYVYFEVYGPAEQKETKTVGLAASLSLFRGGVKAFESEAVRLTQKSGPKSRYVPIEFQTPLAGLASGRYTAQLDVIDELGQKFAFRRSPLVVLPYCARGLAPVSQAKRVDTGACTRLPTATPVLSASRHWSCCRSETTELVEHVTG